MRLNDSIVCLSFTKRQGVPDIFNRILTLDQVFQIQLTMQEAVNI